MENINREIELESRSRRYTDRLQSANIKIKEMTRITVIDVRGGSL